jgi:hypothetical protein
MFKRAIAVVCGVATVLTLGATPVQAVPQRHTAVLVINQIPANSKWYTPARQAVSLMNARVHRYDFRYARTCPTGVRYKCIHLRVVRLGANDAGAQNYTLSGGVHADWMVEGNTSYTRRFTPRQIYKIWVHELAHTFGLRHCCKRGNFMNPHVQRSGQNQRFNSAQSRYLARYWNY